VTESEFGEHLATQASSSVG